MAFYANDRIDKWAPSILRVVPSVALSQRIQAPRVLAGKRDDLRGLVDRLVRNRSTHIGTERQVIFLSAPQAPQTIRLARDIEHDRPGGFTRGQRYVAVSSLRCRTRHTRSIPSTHSADVRQPGAVHLEPA